MFVLKRIFLTRFAAFGFDWFAGVRIHHHTVRSVAVPDFGMIGVIVSVARTACPNRKHRIAENRLFRKSHKIIVNAVILKNTRIRNTVVRLQGIMINPRRTNPFLRHALVFPCFCQTAADSDDVAVGKNMANAAFFTDNAPGIVQLGFAAMNGNKRGLRCQFGNFVIVFAHFAVLICPESCIGTTLKSAIFLSPGLMTTVAPC